MILILAPVESWDPLVKQRGRRKGEWITDPTTDTKIQINKAHNIHWNAMEPIISASFFRASYKQDSMFTREFDEI